MRLLGRISARLVFGGVATVSYALYVFLSQIKWSKRAEKLLALASIAASRALGLQIIVDDSQPSERFGEKIVHIFDGLSLFDFLVARVSLGVDSSFIADDDLIREGVFKYKNYSGSRGASGLLKEGISGTGKSFLLVRSGARKISLKPWLFACSSRSLIVPWFFDYDDQNISHVHGEYGFLKLFVSRLARPVLTVRSKRGCSSVFGDPVDLDEDQFVQKIRALYGRKGGVERGV